MPKVVEDVPKVLGGCAEGAWRLYRRCLEVVPKVVEVVLKVFRGCTEGGELVLKVVEVLAEVVIEVMPKVLGGSAKGTGGCGGDHAVGAWGLCKGSPPIENIMSTLIASIISSPSPCSSHNPLS